MSKKKNTYDSLGGLVYSTDPGFKLPENEMDETETLAPAQQQLKIRLDAKHRAGKVVSLVTGFVGQQQDLEVLGKKLKSFCGTGGTVKNSEIIVQGDNRDKILRYLQKNGYSSAKKI